jgi:cation diffusion facilitator CzcD-associated flavoprotein CzcO
MRISLPFPAKLTPEEWALKLDVFWNEFKASAIDRFEDAVMGALSECLWFPSPAELRTLLNETFITRPLQFQIEEKMPRLSTEKAKVMLKKIYETIERAGEKERTERKQRFEKRRAALKEQAQIITKQ